MYNYKTISNNEFDTKTYRSFYFSKEIQVKWAFLYFHDNDNVPMYRGYFMFMQFHAGLQSKYNGRFEGKISVFSNVIISISHFQTNCNKYTYVWVKQINSILDLLLTVKVVFVADLC